MPLSSVNYSRPAATQVNNEAIVLEGALTEGTTAFTFDVTATVNSQVRLIKRIVLTPQYSGVNFFLKVEEYNFAGTSIYVSASNPATSTAINATAPTTYNLSTTDLDAFYTAAGDVRS